LIHSPIRSMNLPGLGSVYLSAEEEEEPRIVGACWDHFSHHDLLNPRISCSHLHPDLTLPPLPNHGTPLPKPSMQARASQQYGTQATSTSPEPSTSSSSLSLSSQHLSRHKSTHRHTYTIPVGIYPLLPSGTHCLGPPRGFN
jgi:hypothetical protein